MNKLNKLIKDWYQIFTKDAKYKCDLYWGYIGGSILLVLTGIVCLGFIPFSIYHFIANFNDPEVRRLTLGLGYIFSMVLIVVLSILLVDYGSKILLYKINKLKAKYCDPIKK